MARFEGNRRMFIQSSEDVTQFNDTAARRIGRLADASISLSGFRDDDGVTAMLRPSELVPFSHITYRRAGWRYEVVEHKTRVKSMNQAADGTVEFQAVEPVTKVEHPRRFWFAWSARRYINRMRPAR